MHRGFCRSFDAQPHDRTGQATNLRRLKTKDKVRCGATPIHATKPLSTVEVLRQIPPLLDYLRPAKELKDVGHQVLNWVDWD